MADIRPFPACRPAKGLESEIAALPYDVYSRTEARAYVASHPGSFLSIDRAETTLSQDIDIYDERVYRQAASLLHDWINIIKKHENTRAEKEQDRIRHVDECSAQTGPIFLCYRSNDVISQVVAKTISLPPVADFVSDGDVRNRVWVISDQKDCDAIRNAFAGIDSIYIADGHHRCASAVRVGELRRKQKPDYTGEEDFNFFLSVLFPENELKIMDYNRTVHDLNGLTPSELVGKIEEICEIIPGGSAASGDRKAPETEGVMKPSAKGEIGMYLDGSWYLLRIRPQYRSDDPVAGLDVSILQNRILTPILGIGDPKTDTRIEFVGGIRGTKELEQKADSFHGVSFLMYPTSIGELFAVADAGRLMPPKSTWFEPKLLSGLFIHLI